MFVYLFVCLFICCLFVCLFVCLLVCLSPAVIADEALPPLLLETMVVDDLLMYDLPSSKTAFRHRLTLLYHALHRYARTYSTPRYMYLPRIAQVHTYVPIVRQDICIYHSLHRYIHTYSMPRYVYLSYTSEAVNYRLQWGSHTVHVQL